MVQSSIVELIYLKESYQLFTMVSNYFLCVRVGFLFCFIFDWCDLHHYRHLSTARITRLCYFQ